MIDYKSLEDDTLSILGEIKLLQYSDIPNDKRVLILDHIAFLSEMIQQQVLLSMSIIRKSDVL